MLVVVVVVIHEHRLGFVGTVMRRRLTAVERGILFSLFSISAGPIHDAHRIGCRPTADRRDRTSITEAFQLIRDTPPLPQWRRQRPARVASVTNLGPEFLNIPRPHEHPLPPHQPPAASLSLSYSY